MATLDDSAIAAAVTPSHRRQALWEAVSRSLAMLLVMAAGILGLWVTSRNTIYSEFRHYLIGMAEVGASLVDPGLHDSLRRPEQLNGADYARAVAPLRRLRGAVPDIHYVYTLVREKGVVHFVLDAADPGNRNRSGGPDQSGVWEVYEPSGPPLDQVFGQGGRPGTAIATAEPVTDQWGTFMSALAPLIDASGRQIGAIGVDVDASIYVARLRQARIRALLGLVPAGLLIALFGWIYYRIRLRGLAAVAARKSMELALLEAAHQDKLTGLPNRTVFMERLQLALRPPRAAPFAVLFLDFDRFKLINDTRGHQAGDELLRQISRRLQVALEAMGCRTSAGDTLVSRFGGDEFLILVHDAQGERSAQRIAAGLLSSLVAPYDVLGGEVHSTASIGIVTCEPGSPCDSAEEIVRNADVAMYEAKSSGRGCYVVFDESMHARLERHVEIENSLHKVIGSPELRLEYQPIVDLRSGRRTYVEALLRWHHPTLGLIEPRELLPIAEESGLMVTLGQWVLQDVCRSLAAWRAQDPQNAPEKVSINLSRAQLAQGDRLITQLSATLAQFSLPPHCVQLEVSEREVMRNPDATRALLRKLREAGLKLAMDDFGTGQSSLSRLRGYPFDSIKIDSSFLQDLNTSHEVLAVIHATINLIENLGMASVAEGVEDATQVAILQSLGCRYAQGIYFSAPVPADQVLRALTAPLAPDAPRSVASGG